MADDEQYVPTDDQVECAYVEFNYLPTPSLSDVSNEIDYVELSILSDEATPGPWELGEINEWDGVRQASVEVPNGCLTWDDHNGEVFKPEDAEFIAAARTAVPELLQENAALRARVKKLEELWSNAGWAADMDRQGGA